MVDHQGRPSKSRRHRRTDPGCIRFKYPRSRVGLWLFNRARGRGCPVCYPPRTFHGVESLDAFVDLMLDRDAYVDAYAAHINLTVGAYYAATVVHPDSCACSRCGPVIFPHGY